jgi:ribosomal protein S18 acetylase RimI-like enzyme
VASVAEPLTHTPASGLRAFDVQRDMRGVADLVEVCFADTLDADGERYLDQLRSAANNAPYLRWAQAASDWVSVPLNGYVWYEDGRLVGNASIIPFFVKGRRQFLIANVATLPNYRRRGIARSLTVRAMQQIRSKGMGSAWLHVREENDAAVELYRDLGFVERYRRTTWQSKPGYAASPPLPGVQLGPPSAGEWRATRPWLEAAYPPEVTWQSGVEVDGLQPGLWGGLGRLLSGSTARHWNASAGGRVQAGLALYWAPGHGSTFWLAALPDASDDLIAGLLIHARNRADTPADLTLDYIAHRWEIGLTAAGFYPHQTLIWMQAVFS